MKTRKWILLTISLAGIFACNEHAAKTINCAHFKKGRFSSHSELTGSNYLIERGDSIQTELDGKTGSLVRLSVEWLSDCEYELKFSNITLGKTDSLPENFKWVTIRTRILATTENYYIYETSDPDNKLPKSTDTMFIIRAQVVH